MGSRRLRFVLLLLCLLFLSAALGLHYLGYVDLYAPLALEPDQLTEAIAPSPEFHFVRTRKPPLSELDRRYRTPLRAVYSPARQRLYVSATNAQTVLALNPATGKIDAEFGVGQLPSGLALAPDQARLYVANRFSDTVSVIDLRSGRVLCHVVVDNQPYDLLAHPRSGDVYVTCVGRDESVCKIDATSNRVVRRVRLPDNPRHVALSPDGRHLAVTCDSPGLERYVVLLDASTLQVRKSIPVRPAANLRGIVFLDDSTIAFAYSIPRPEVSEAGEPAPWNHAVGICRIDEESDVRSFVLDTQARYYANPYDVILYDDGHGRRWLAVSCGGADRVVLIDARWLQQLYDQLPLARHAPGPRPESNADYEQHVVVGANPYGLATGGGALFVVNRLDDSVTAVTPADREWRKRTLRVGPEQWSALREGEILFNSAELCYRNQFACATCHPEGHNARLAWDLADDGKGTFKDIKSLRGIAGTGPFRWQGEAKSVGDEECLPTVEHVMRGPRPLKDEIRKLEAYVLSIPHVPNPFRKPNGELTEKAKRGKEIFEGDYIAGCVKCHFEHDEILIVRRAPGTGKGRPDELRFPDGDRILPDEYDVPHLRGTWDDGPWLHDGRAKTLADAVYMHNAEEHAHIKGEDMEALVEYLRSL